MFEKVQYHGEIQYTRPSGSTVHSDICFDGLLDDEDRAFLVDVFKEFISNWDGTNGHFRLGENAHMEDDSDDA